MEREIDPAATLKLFRIAPSEWNVNDVSAFLSAVGLHEIRDELFDRNVDGPQFIDLTDADLTKFEESNKHLLLNAVKVISKVIAKYDLYFYCNNLVDDFLCNVKYIFYL